MIQTERLSIIPLTYDELNRYKWVLTEAERDCVDSFMDGTQFRTLWMLAYENNVIGELMFYGEPDESGEVEIGCRMRESHRNMRFMSEAIGGVVAWAKVLGIKSIKAKIEHANTASIRMCESNGFLKVEDNIWKIKL